MEKIMSAIIRPCTETTGEYRLSESHEAEFGHEWDGNIRAYILNASEDEDARSCGDGPGVHRRHPRFACRRNRALQRGRHSAGMLLGGGGMSSAGKEGGRVAALYIRVSTLDQAREGYSLAAQQAALEAWAAQKSYATQLYADEGISGKDIGHRPAMRPDAGRRGGRQDCCGSCVGAVPPDSQCGRLVCHAGAAGGPRRGSNKPH